MVDETTTEEKIHKAFRAFDVDGDGVIDSEDLGRLLKALDPGVWTDDVVQAFMVAADSNEDGQIPYVEFLDWVHADGGGGEMVDAGAFLAEECPEGMRACKYGKSCYCRKPDHCREFWHPLRETMKANQRRACRYGFGCYRRNTGHLEAFAHPGDRNYRNGLVFFGRSKGPEFQTLWQVFQFYDPDESGQLSKTEFGDTLEELVKLGLCSDDLESAWAAVGGEEHGYVNFARFALWADGVGIDLATGIEDASSSRPCHFRMMVSGGWSCGCAEYEAGSDGWLCGACGHKPSMHRSDLATKSNSEVLDGCRPESWKEGESGLVPVDEGDPVFGMLQEMMDRTHKTEDNWTRDRGCKIHGRGHGDCSWPCIRANGWPVPTGYTLKKVLRNQNIGLWQKNSIMKKAITQECMRPCEQEYREMAVESHADLDSPLATNCNEWRLFHGSSWGACRGISDSNFRLSLSGTGATWKKPGEQKGSPLYGYGIYLAERITKADEYAGVVPDGEDGAGLNCALVCRALGGRAHLITTNEIDKVKLRNDVFDGPYHAIFGDRVVTLGKPYREIVMYDKDQIYPEYIIMYERRFD
mmetsp:Transcript_9865/g.25972  ORF Transcript_9865/g.25972 Transcript_9865/m.25972 type:complete len:583 (+) Transcript_9865:189-1937(+)|eukprot:CAMPEP_0117471790 /NCGR_PEP_ID=MMETSP0784-20121206/7912_1 /TAXON_ID=39447 /ORGANISM="" /LENGTH=582 /DNA_ID=CAMNT_0005265919 /DNA_START=122 /DNA_END=1870 /DNA_ORIENTATION=-